MTQELLGELMSSTGSSSPTEATAALETLVELAEEDTLGMLQFAAFLGTLLDYLASFTDHQLHLVRLGLSCCCAHRDQRPSTLSG